jgi:predicted DNA-binding transcriptional regulator AlpA
MRQDNSAPQPEEAPTGDLLTPAQAAEISGLTEGTLANFRSSGRGPRFYKIGGTRYVRYDSAELDRWMRSRCYENTAQVHA